MTTQTSRFVLPHQIRLDAATACQLKCPACPTASGETGKRIGTGFLKFADFKNLVDGNPWVSRIELSNWGEIFLNKDLLKILEYGHKRSVALTASNGTNLNTVKDEVLEGLVKYKLRHMTCSVDGASQDTYVQYRVNGNFDTVLDNIKRINYWKDKYKSEFPVLLWQFVAFGHNEHEISTARRMAREMHMQFYLKLSWDDLYTKEFSPVKNKELIRIETGLGVASRQEYRQTFGHEYVERTCCAELWKNPQVSMDGKVLGCPVNYWSDYGNAFKEGLKETLTNESISYARDMLQGKVPPRKGIACTTCKVFHRIQEAEAWIKDDEISLPYIPSRRYIRIENTFGVKPAAFARRLYWQGPSALVKEVIQRARKMARSIQKSGTVASDIFPIAVPQAADPVAGWKAYPIIHGTTAGTTQFSCHTSVLMPGHCPHPPHEHQDEEILMMLSGHADLILPELGTNGEPATVPIAAGQFVYYPAYFFHTLRASGDTPANYLMFKWFSKPVVEEKALGYGFYEMNAASSAMPGQETFRTRLLFEGPTENLGKLHCHLSTLMPGAGYTPHVDPYDVAIIVLEGSVETLGRRVEPCGLIFYRAGEHHGLENPTDHVARYVVFEFHGRRRRRGDVKEPSPLVVFQKKG